MAKIFGETTSIHLGPDLEPCERYIAAVHGSTCEVLDAEIIWDELAIMFGQEKPTEIIITTYSVNADFVVGADEDIPCEVFDRQTEQLFVFGGRILQVSGTLNQAMRTVYSSRWSTIEVFGKSQIPELVAQRLLLTSP